MYNDKANTNLLTLSVDLELKYQYQVNAPSMLDKGPTEINTFYRVMCQSVQWHSKIEHKWEWYVFSFSKDFDLGYWWV